MAAEFFAEKGLLKGLILSLEGDQELIIGRDPDQSDLVIEDPKASRRHLLCRKIPEGFLIENLSATNPAKVNEVPLTEPYLLKDKDRVTIGSTQFRFYLEGHPEFPLIEDEPEAYPEDEGLEEDTIFKEEVNQIPEIKLDLSQTSRFILKVIAGPNTGAEFALEPDKTYLLGTDTATCDIIFYDLSVSREHARLTLTKEGKIFVEDLGSRNGVLIDKERIDGRRLLPPNIVVTLGTSSFLVIDQEAPTETIIASIYEPPTEETEEKIVKEEVEEGIEGPPEPIAPAPVAVASLKPRMSMGALILAVILGGMTILFGIAVISLFKETSVNYVPRDYDKELHEALAPFPAVKYTYNKNNSKLFLVGHVATAVEKSELLYNLQGLPFIKGYEDNIVADDAVWQEMNLLLASQDEFKGVSLHSPTPGKFVLTGYLESMKQYSDLIDYMNLNFSFLDLLEYNVVVKEQVIDSIKTQLLENGFNGVDVAFNNGDLTLTGYISATRSTDFQNLIGRLQLINGVRNIKNYVVALSPEQAVVDLNERYPGHYQVTGYSRHGNININVVINGHILTRGDNLDGMVITSIQPHAIFLEKEGLKYKIEYNKWGDDSCLP